MSVLSLLLLLKRLDSLLVVLGVEEEEGVVDEVAAARVAV